MKFVISLAVCLVVWALGGLLSYYEGAFFQEQIAERLQVRGLPFWNHGQMWTDATIVAPVVSYVIYKYSAQWKKHEVYVFSWIALVVSAVMHYKFVQSPVPGCHIYGGQLTWSGWDHFLFTILAFTPLLLFYFWTLSSFRDVTVVSLALFAHLLAGFQLPWYLGVPILDSMTLAQFAGGLTFLSIGAIVAFLRLSRLPHLA